MKFLNKLIVLPESSDESNGSNSDGEIEFLKDMRNRVKDLEKEVCGETLEEAVENGSIKGRKAKEIKQRLAFIEGL